MSDNIMPSCPAIEAQILSSFINNRDTMLNYSSQISSEMFYQQWSKDIYKYIVASNNCDSLILMDTFPQYSDKIIECITSTASHINLCAEIDTLKDRYYRRCAIDAANILSMEAQTDYDTKTEDILGKVQEKIMRIFKSDTNKPEHISTILPRALADLQGCINNKTDGITTGLDDVDNVLGSFVKGELTILAARPSMGKSSLGLQIARYNAINKNIPTLFFNIEMAEAITGNRVLFSDTPASYELARRGNMTELEKTRQNIDRVSSAPLWIDSSSDITVGQLIIKTEQHISMNGIRLVIIDQLQVLRSSEDFKSKNDLYEAITGDLHRTVKRFNIPIICLSQLSRACESRNPPRPILSDLRDSGAIEQNADVVMFIYRPEYYFPNDDKLKGMAEIIVAKNRNGQTGYKDVLWDDKTMNFKNLDKTRQENNW